MRAPSWRGGCREEQLDHFRREALWPGGLSSYPHPRLMPDFWQFPTVSMGLGPINAIYQARFNRYLAARGIVDTSASRVWGFLGDGEMDEPEALGALGLAAREGLDNLIFVVNCNLQRLDGPVRGNGKIIQELEATFRGAGWHVIKVIWAREWDDLLARDKDGVLLTKMNETLDGDYQRLSVADGAYIREHFFGPDPRLKALVEHLPDEDLPKLRRGGHDYRKVYAAYAAAVEHTGSPVVILAKTVKGWTLGPGIEARNVTHQAKKLTQDELKIFRDRLELPIPDDQLAEAPYYHPGPESPEIQYMLERRNQLGGAVPRRVVRPMPLPDAADEAYAELFAGSERAASHHHGLQPADAEPDPRRDHRAPDRADHPGRGAHLRHGSALQGGRASTTRSASATRRSTRSCCSPTWRRRTARSWRRASPRPAPWPTSPPPAPLRRARPADDPLLHLLLDVRLPAHRRPGLGVRRRARPRLPDGRHRRPHHAHRRGAAARRRAQPHPGLGPCRTSAPTTRPSPTSWRSSCATASGACTASAQEDVFYYVTLYNENWAMPPKPEGVEEGVAARPVPASDRPTGGSRRVQLLASGSILHQALKAQPLLAERYDIAADLWSVPSFQQLRNDALEIERWNRLHPEAEARVPYVVAAARPRPRDRSWPPPTTSRRCPHMVAPWIDRPFTALGTDGFGRSDTREALRIHFEVSPEQIAYAALHGLCLTGAAGREELARAIGELGIDPGANGPAARLSRSARRRLRRRTAAPYGRPRRRTQAQ